NASAAGSGSVSSSISATDSRTADSAVPPLEGVRILDLTRLLPGAYATLVLADLGADVIKIEDPRGGDAMRRTAGGAFFERVNRNKRSVTLDLRSPDAARVLDALAAESDG